MVTLYGIPNCDTMKKARLWLEQHGIDYHFHNYKKEGLQRATLEAWEAELGWETMFNKRGMMWRKLSDETKQGINRDHALDIMLETPTIIKRPLLDTGNRRHVGFTPESYQAIFA